jgi:DNA-binding MarR family transcriptional regulator
MMHQSNSDREETVSDDEAYRLLRALWELQHAIGRTSRAMARSAGVTLEQRMLLRHIGRFPGLTASQLVEHFVIDAGTVSTLLAKLERAGLVERRPGSRDRRRVEVGLTEAGHRLNQSVPQGLYVAAREVVAKLGGDYLESARRVLLALTERIDRDGSQLRERADRE